MELVLDSKFTESLNKINKSNSFYSVYSLKVNRSNIDSNNNSNHKSSVAYFLDKEATINKDFSLSLILNNIPNENEAYLRENLAKKVEKGTFYASNTGYIAIFNLNLKRDENENESICYYHLYRYETNNSTNELIICFTIDDSSHNLDLFRNELDFYFDRYLKPIFSSQLANEYGSNQSLIDLLENWYDNSINYLSRTFHLLKNNNLSVFIDEALTCGSLNLVNLDEKTNRDLNILFKSFNSSYLLLTTSSKQNNEMNDMTKLDNLNSESKLTISFDNSSKDLVLSKKESSQFSIECANSLLSQKENDSFKSKQELENFKLKLAQELNTFNRYLRKSQSHYYDLYKLYLYLKSSPISQTLVHMHKNKELSSDLNKLLNIVVDFYNKQKIK